MFIDLCVPFRILSFLVGWVFQYPYQVYGFKSICKNTDFKIFFGVWGLWVLLLCTSVWDSTYSCISVWIGLWKIEIWIVFHTVYYYGLQLKSYLNGLFQSIWLHSSMSLYILVAGVSISILSYFLKYFFKLYNNLGFWKIINSSQCQCTDTTLRFWLGILQLFLKTKIMS